MVRHIKPKTGENYDILRDGLKIYTIDSCMQQYAEEAVVQYACNTEKTGLYHEK